MIFILNFLPNLNIFSLSQCSGNLSLIFIARFLDFQKVLPITFHQSKISQSNLTQDFFPNKNLQTLPRFSTFHCLRCTRHI
jgi:hypothetical protein